MRSAPRRALWTCPACGEKFVTPRIFHSCGKHSYDALFAKSEPVVREIFAALVQLAEACGPVRVYPQKTRVVFQARMRFASGQPRKRAFVGGFIVPLGTTSPRMVKEEFFGSKRCFGLHVRCESVADVDAEIARLMKIAYRVGRQEHLAADPS